MKSSRKRNLSNRSKVAAFIPTIEHQQAFQAVKTDPRVMMVRDFPVKMVCDALNCLSPRLQDPTCCCHEPVALLCASLCPLCWQCDCTCHLHNVCVIGQSACISWTRSLQFGSLSILCPDQSITRYAFWCVLATQVRMSIMSSTSGMMSTAL